MRTHVYDKVCERISMLTNNRDHQKALFLIFSELFQGNDLGVDYLRKRYITTYRKGIGRNTLHLLLKQLREDDLIEVETYGDRFKRRANHYRSTIKVLRLVENSSRRYLTYGDYQRKRNALSTSDVILERQWQAPAHNYIADWLAILPEGESTNSFIKGLIRMSNKEVIFKRHEALANPAALKSNRQFRNIPDGPYNVNYRPLRSGRLQSVPHSYIGKELVPYIVPYQDPYLQDGILFSLDYSSQELRILASMLPESSCIYKWALDPENHFSQMLKSYDVQIPAHLQKGFMYSFLYGSQGHALSEELTYYEALELGFESSMAAARAFVSDFNAKVPELNKLREGYGSIFSLDHKIMAPGGVFRYVNPEEDLTKRGMVKKNRARSIPLSHIIQGTGAYIARTIVAESVNLKYCQLHMPIHDGFVFYCRKGLYEQAVREANELMTSVAESIVPNIPMPHKLEWIVGQEGQV